MIYCHGLPGGAGDLGIAGWPERLRPTVMSPMAESLPGGGPYQIVGFSGGAWTALRLAASHPERVKSVSLIGPVAPLELGDFTALSVSGPLLGLARNDPPAADTALRDVAAAAETAPDAVLDSLFEGTPQGELDLVRDPLLRPHYLDNLTSGLGDGLDETIAAFLSVAGPWSDLLASVRAPVSILVGSEDRRCPPAMAQALAAAIGDHATVEVLDGLGHYGALRAFAARL